jgi:para-aminobenzoate synthetase
MDIIDSLESSARGIYSGALGYLSFNGAVDLSMTIRTIVASPRTLSIGVGGGIVVLSDPQEEFEEMLLKGKALMTAVSEYQSRRVAERLLKQE